MEETHTAGYSVGPTIPVEESPWPLGWEQDPRIDDGHDHQWESVLLGGESGDGYRRRVEEVVRCAVCLAPRCGWSRDRDPCMLRRHHRSCHRYLSGQTEHLGGIAAMCSCARNDREA